MRVPEGPVEEMALSMQQKDRRAAGVRRVPVERIVDVCGMKSAAGSAFQGWSIDVSGRGMSIRAAHVPELAAPVIVRFQEHGSEVIAEAQVVWRNESPAGCEFGVRFTALDSRSVQALKALCQSEPLPSLHVDALPPPPKVATVFTLKAEPAPAPKRVLPTAKEPAGDDDHDTEPAPPAASSVKLHIDGLTAPMQARVRQQGPRKMALGSQLEFLRVGRDVEVEGAEGGGRRRARIEEVDVAIDPDSQVPELIVSLCYDTPLPRPVSTDGTESPRVFESRERLPTPGDAEARAPANPIGAVESAEDSGSPSGQPPGISPPRPAPREAASWPRRPEIRERSGVSLAIPRPAPRSSAAASSGERLQQVFAVDVDTAEEISAEQPSISRYDGDHRGLAGNDAPGESPSHALQAMREGAPPSIVRPSIASAHGGDDGNLRDDENFVHRHARSGGLDPEMAEGARELPAGALRARAPEEGPRAVREHELSEERPGLSLEMIDDADVHGDETSDAERLRERLDGVLENLSSAARRASAGCQRFGAVASRSARWVAVQAKNVGRAALAARSGSLPRRTAAAPRPPLRPGTARSTRASARPGSAIPLSQRVPRGVAFGGAVVATVAAATWLGRGSPEAGPVRPRVPAVQTVPAALQPGSSGPSLEDAPGPSQRQRAPAPPDDAEAAESEATSALAQRGPLEPASSAAARSAAAPSSGRASLDVSAPERRGSIEKRALARYQAAEHDFDGAPAPSPRKAIAAAAEFGSGRLQLPTVYRLRLDQPGVSLRGERTPTGFDVIIPGRKVLESGTAIAKRDPNFAKVSTTNGSEGARISFRFRSGVPAYKVRLRNGDVEFFINSQ
jgi:hypothetical protein